VDQGDISGGAPTAIHRWTGTVYVAQGAFVDREWEVTGAQDEFIIDQANVDTDFLVVNVRASQGSTILETWTYAKTLTEVGPSTEAYFLQEASEGIQIYFGNDSVGKALVAGQYLSAEYLVTSGSISNGIRTFGLTQSIAGYPAADFTISNVTPVSDAADRETIASIRQLAPLSYSRQNRIVTIEDYKTAVLEQFSNIKAINAWGGEDAVPPQYGKVFVSVAPVFGDTVSPTTKKSIEEDVLNKFSVVGITPEIVDPEYLRISLTTTVKYNKDRTTLNASDITTQVQDTITTFFDDQVFDYEQSFKYSRFLSAVDDTHASIISSLAEVTLGKSFTPVSNTAATYEIKFFNALVPGTLTSIGYTNTGGNTVTFADDSQGNIDFYINGSLTASGIGTIDYDNGICSLPGFNANMQTIGPVILQATPVSKDVQVSFNNLAQLSTNTVIIKDIRE
jgi:hypothetical protein